MVDLRNSGHQPASGVLIGIVIVLAWLILFAAICHLIFAFQSHGVGGILWQVLLTLVYGIAGIYMLLRKRLRSGGFHGLYMLDCHGKTRAFPGTTLQEKEGHELTDSVTSRPEIPLFQREIPLSQLGWLLQSLWPDSWQPDLPQARLFRSFARTPRGARHWPECRCICSWVRCRRKTGSRKY
jgi:hypothetical protein